MSVCRNIFTHPKVVCGGGSIEMAISQQLAGGTLTDMNDLGIIEPISVKAQMLKTSVEAACTLLRVDDIVAGVSVGGGDAPTSRAADDAEEG